MAAPIGSIINQVPGPPYDSQREALLYEILQALGGNPDEIMSKPWTSGNEGNSRPPYTSLTDALLYEIWMVIQDGGAGSGSAGSSTIYYGIVKEGTSINPLSGLSHKIINQGANFFIIPPAISNITGNELTNVRLWVAEPNSEPVKNGTLWIRNIQSAFTNQPIQNDGLMSVQGIGGFRVYSSELIPAQLFNGEYFGPVFFSKARQIAVDFGTPPPDPDPEPNVHIVNNSGDGNSLIDVALNGNYNWFNVLQGDNFPLLNTQEVFGNHIEFTGIISFRAYKIGINPLKVILLKNNFEIDCISVGPDSNAVVEFSPHHFEINDNLKIEMLQGICN